MARPLTRSSTPVHLPSQHRIIGAHEQVSLYVPLWSGKPFVGGTASWSILPYVANQTMLPPQILPKLRTATAAASVTVNGKLRFAGYDSSRSVDV
jgi:hypothetical protein